MNKVLITGGSGLIGKRLTELLLAKGYDVNILGRHHHRETKAGLRSFKWDVAKDEIEQEAFNGVTAIIHLAGTNIADKNWTAERKKEIIESRVKSAELIYDYLSKNQHTVKVFASASGVDYYGDCGAEVIKEEHPIGTGFLAEVCQQWEAAAMRFEQLGIREVRCRTGIVLSAKGAALPALTKTIPFGLAEYFAKPPLYYPWIHIDDICGIYIHAIENEQVAGAFNASAPSPLPMKELMKEILKAKKSNALLLPVPPMLLKLALGDRSSLLLNSHLSSAEKIMASGYKFRFGEIGRALGNIFA